MTRNRLRATRPARGGRTPRTFRALTSRSLGCKALLTAVLVVSVGCASIHHGRRQRVVMESEPPGAAVYLGDRHLGVTLIDLELSGSDLANGLRLRKDGFEPVHVRFDRKTSRWLWGDVGLATWNGIASTQALTGAGPVYAFAGMLALTLGIDLMTGAILRAPDAVRTTLAPRPLYGATVPEGIVVPAGRPDAEVGTATGDR